MVNDQFQEMGRRWLAGYNFKNFNCRCPDEVKHRENHQTGVCTGIWFNEKQKAFVNAKERFVLVSGGFASGKTTGFIVKLWLLCMMFPGNRILLGRKSRQDVERATLPDIIDIFPSGTYEHKVGPGKILFANGSEIIFYGLDALQSGNGDDIKKAEQAIKGLNLGAFFIDQLEEIELKVFEKLDGRLRRNVPFRQGNFTTNPANFWAYDYFKANPRAGTRLIQASMLDNKDNLPQDYLESQLSKGEMYIRRYVYGEWTPDVLIAGTVFGEMAQKDQAFHVKAPIREIGGIKVYVEPTNHEYQIGVDPSTGAEDPCSIVVVDKFSGEVVATFSGYVPTNVITAKTIVLAEMYSKSKKPLVVPEATGVGQAFVEDLKKQWSHIYEREVFSRREKKEIDKLGFYTNYATKIQLIENMRKLFDSRWPKIREKAILDEMQTFIYTDEARKQGAGAQGGYHDDRVMATMLAFWNLKFVPIKEKNLLETRQEKRKTIRYQYQ